MRNVLRFSVAVLLATSLVSRAEAVDQPAIGFEKQPAEKPTVEHQLAIDGTSQAAVAPTFLGTGTVGPHSYFRFFNASSSATSTYTVRVVGVPSGTQYGSNVALPIPPLATNQISLPELVDRAGRIPGSFTGGDTGYAIYIQNSDKTAGYQHVVYNWTTNLFENLSNCESTLNAQMIDQQKQMVLSNVHTEKGSATGVSFPSTISIHNRSSSAINYTIKIYNAGKALGPGSSSANSGKLTCTIPGNIVQANSTLSILESTLESRTGCAFDSDQDYANIIVTNATSPTSAPNAVLTHMVHVSQYDGDSNLTDFCAVNKIATTTAASTTPVSYCGIATIPAASGGGTASFVASVATNGRMRGYLYGANSLGEIYGGMIGVLTGTSFSGTTTPDNYAISGTIQNGTLSGTTGSDVGLLPLSGSTTACN